MAWSVRTCRLRRPSAVELTRLALGFCVITTMCVFLSGSKSMMDSVIQEVKAAGAKGNPKINLLSDTNLLSDKLKEQFAEEGIKGNQIDQLSGRLNQDQEMELAVGNVDTPHPHTNLHPDDLTLIDIHPFTIEINQDICNVSDIALVTIIHSAVKNNDARRIIRDTWGNPKIPGVNTRLVFLVGQSDEPDKEAELKEEAYQFNDIIQGGFHDSYRNLSYKSIFGKLWVSEFCEQAEFVVKTDDDMFIDLYATYHITRQYLEHPKYLGNEFILCPKWYGMGIIRDPESKSYVSYEEISKEEAPTNGFPTYCTGWIYILNPGTARRLDFKHKFICFIYIHTYITLHYFWMSQISRGGRGKWKQRGWIGERNGKDKAD